MKQNRTKPGDNVLSLFIKEYQLFFISYTTENCDDNYLETQYVCDITPIKKGV